MSLALFARWIGEDFHALGPAMAVAMFEVKVGEGDQDACARERFRLVGVMNLSEVTLGGTIKQNIANGI